MPALRVLWAALVAFYDETLTLLAANLAWFALNAPLLVLLVLIWLPIAGEGDGPARLLAATAWLLLFLPTPAAVGLGAVARAAAGPNVPRFRRLFWPAVRARWRLAGLLSFLSLLGAAVLIANTYFYAVVSSGWLKFASIVWLYGLLFWFALHLYLVPLLLQLPEPRPLDLYRRAALIALGHPGYTLALTVCLVLVGVLSLLFLPAYPLVAGAYVALVQAHAFRYLRRQAGELLPDEESEVA